MTPAESLAPSVLLLEQELYLIIKKGRKMILRTIDLCTTILKNRMHKILDIIIGKNQLVVLENIEQFCILFLLLVTKIYSLLSDPFTLMQGICQ